MKNNYKQVAKLLKKIDELRKKYREIAYLEAGVISKGPEVDVIETELHNLELALQSEVALIINNNGRLSHIRNIVGREPFVDKMIIVAEVKKYEGRPELNYWLRKYNPVLADLLGIAEG